MTAPEHDLVMPHDVRFYSPDGNWDVRSCPPNCPYRLYYEKRGYLAPPEHDLCGPDAPKTATGLAYEQGRRAERERWVRAIGQLHTATADGQHCAFDGVPWPCKTAKAVAALLEGEKP